MAATDPDGMWSVDRPAPTGPTTGELRVIEAGKPPKELQAMAIAGVLAVLGALLGVATVISVRENDASSIEQMADRPIVMLIVGAFIAIISGQPVKR
jgi:hypothetical protein